LPKCSPSELHLQEYKQREKEYLEFYSLNRLKNQATFTFNLQAPVCLKKFSEMKDKDKYNDTPITDDMITDLYQQFVKRTRQPESEEYCKTLTGSY
jgi:preprotein translocase subunit Sss1